MKKKVLCISAIAVWLLAALTFVSMKVEEQMVTQVTLAGVAFDQTTREYYLPANCLQYDETGEHLYSVYEGTGWEAGTRVMEANTFYTLDGDRILLDSNFGEFIQFASKPLRAGELVNVRKDNESQPDNWLAVLPEGEFDGALFSELPKGINIVERNGSAVLFSVASARQPYMESRAISILPGCGQARVYSFAEMEKFLANLDPLGKVFGLLIGPVVLWALTCFMTRDMEKYRLCVCINLGLGVLMLALLPMALSQVDLPSSLLPKERITDFGWFMDEMDRFFGALYSFAPPASEAGRLEPNLPQSEAGRAIIFYKNTMIGRPVYHMVMGVVLPAAAVLLERAVVYIRRMPKIK